MPIGIGTAAYDTSTYVMNLARSICNDAGLSIAGNILADSQPYAVVLLNAAYRKLQEDLSNRGVEVMVKEMLLLAIAACATTDPGIFCYISATGYNDGVSNHAAPLLPADLVGPLRLEERVNGQNADFAVMYPTNDGLPSRPKSLALCEWEWRTNALWLVGSTQVTDIRLRYAAYLPELVIFPVASATQVLIPRADRALAYKVAEMFAESRGSALAPSFAGKYNDHMTDLCRDTARRKQRGNHRRQPYSRRSGWNI